MFAKEIHPSVCNMEHFNVQYVAICFSTNMLNQLFLEEESISTSVPYLHSEHISFILSFTTAES